jgi:hypothetical protein
MGDLFVRKRLREVRKTEIEKRSCNRQGKGIRRGIAVALGESRMGREKRNLVEGLVDCWHWTRGPAAKLSNGKIIPRPRKEVDEKERGKKLRKGSKRIFLLSTS